MDVSNSKVSSSLCDAGYAPTRSTPGITQLLSGVGPQYWILIEKILVVILVNVLRYTVESFKEKKFSKGLNLNLRNLVI